MFALLTGIGCTSQKDTMRFPNTAFNAFDEKPTSFGVTAEFGDVGDTVFDGHRDITRCLHHLQWKRVKDVPLPY